MLFRTLIVLTLFSPIVSSITLAEDRLAEYYHRAIPAVKRFLHSFDRGEPTSDFTIFTIFNHIAILVSANADLPEEQRPSLETVAQLLRLAETILEPCRCNRSQCRRVRRCPNVEHRSRYSRGTSP